VNTRGRVLVGKRNEQHGGKKKKEEEKVHKCNHRLQNFPGKKAVLRIEVSWRNFRAGINSEGNENKTVGDMRIRTWQTNCCKVRERMNPQEEMTRKLSNTSNER